LTNVLGRLFGRAYAAWCTKRMASDAGAEAVFARGLGVPGDVVYDPAHRK
jgi:hypothetical protein